MIKLELSIEEVNYILQTIGQLPTSTGAWVLLAKIKEQAEALQKKRARDLITIEMFDKAGHALFVDEAESFNQAVLKFSQQAFARKK
jgi:pimeloyl-ACP methyl ester carboxylesterase